MAQEKAFEIPSDPKPDFASLLHDALSRCRGAEVQEFAAVLAEHLAG